MKKNVKLMLKIVIFIIPAVMLVFFAMDYFATDGHAHYEFDFIKKNPKISRLFPANRVEEINFDLGLQKILFEPVYFHVKMPVSFTKAVVELSFNPNEQNVIELGYTMNEQGNQLFLKPIYNKIIEQFVDLENWDLIKEDNLLLLQKNKQYESVVDLKKNQIDNSKVALYNYNMSSCWYPENYVKNEKYQDFDVIIKGKHEILTYIENEKLDFEFVFLNKVDKGKIIVLDKENRIIFEKQMSEKIEKIEITDLLPAYYKIVIDINNEDKIVNIKTKQKLWVFVNELNIVDEVRSRPVRLFTNANRMFFVTDQDAFQTLKINNENLEISRKNIQYEFEHERFEDTYIEIQKTILKINSTGLLAVAKENYFNPFYKDFRAFRTIEQVDVDYIIADYSKPKKENDLLIQKIEFSNFNPYYDIDRLVKFVISVPGLGDGEVEINKIEIDLVKSPLTLGKIIDKIVTWFKR